MRLNDRDQSQRSILLKGFTLLIGVGLLSGMLWSKMRDPFHREWLSLKTPDGGRLSAVAVMPDRGGPFPVVVFAHGSGSSAESSGEKLQQFATLGLAAVGIEYDKTNQARFDAQFAALLDELKKKNWARGGSIRHLTPPLSPVEAEREPAKTNFQPSTINPQPSTHVAWVGNSLGAQRQLSFLMLHSERQPHTLVRLNGGWVEGFDATILHPPSSTFANLPVWIAHGENDEVFPASDARRVAESLRAAGADVRLNIFSGRGHVFGEDQPLLVKGAAEFCAQEMEATAFAPDNFRPLLWIYWLPAIGFGVGLVVWNWTRHWRHRSAARSVRWLRITAGGALLLAALVSTAHLALPFFPTGPSSVKLAREWCVRPELRAHFDWLASQPGAKSCRIRDLLEHLNLASLQRGQFTASLPENDWREFVLSPWIKGAREDIFWRRELWETIQPHVRRETDAEQAAQIVVRELRKRTIIVNQVDEKGLSTIWATGVATDSGFEQLYVAGLRSIGVGAKLNSSSKCELFYNGKWQQAPRPLIDTQP